MGVGPGGVGPVVAGNKGGAHDCIPRIEEAVRVVESLNIFSIYHVYVFGMFFYVILGMATLGRAFLCLLYLVNNNKF